MGFRLLSTSHPSLKEGIEEKFTSILWLDDILVLFIQFAVRENAEHIEL